MNVHPREIKIVITRFIVDIIVIDESIMGKKRIPSLHKFGDPETRTTHINFIFEYISIESHQERYTWYKAD